VIRLLQAVIANPSRFPEAARDVAAVKVWEHLTEAAAGQWVLRQQQYLPGSGAIVTVKIARQMD
jgi:hypothetical protein